ncbi:MAG TPA: hypothetical protein VKX17_02465 [Planctomycetota bacterium]|nr:hypothetical protein [Planctomycetota bacterium]
MTTDSPNPYAKLDDLCLIKLFDQGDDDAFDTLFARHRTKVVAVALEVLKDPAQAEICADQTHGHLSCLHVERLRPDSQFLDWMLGITRIKAEYKRRELNLSAKAKARHAAKEAARLAARPSDEKLLWVLARRGNKKSFEALFERELDGIYDRMWTRFPNSPAKVEAGIESLREAAFRRLSEATPESFRKWLLALARRKNPMEGPAPGKPNRKHR